MSEAKFQLLVQKELVQSFSSDTFLLSECPYDCVHACVCMWKCKLHAHISTSMTQSRPLISPLVDVVFQLLVQLVLLDALFPLCKCLIPLKQFILYVLIFIFFGRLVVPKGGDVIVDSFVTMVLPSWRCWTLFHIRRPTFWRFFSLWSSLKSR